MRAFAFILLMLASLTSFVVRAHLRQRRTRRAIDARLMRGLQLVIERDHGEVGPPVLPE